ncbi:MAG: divergent polysaccharide deacetylase family protein [Thermodesulfobacteriota bacterium]
MGQDRQSPFSSPARLVFWGWAACAILVILALVLVRPAPPRPAAAPVPPVPLPAAPAPDQPAGEAAPYEEPLGAPLDRVAKLADYALASTMAALNLAPDRLVIRELRAESQGQETYHSQILEIELPDPDRFARIFGRNLAAWAPQAQLAHTQAGAWNVTALGRTTHTLLLTRPESAAPAPRATGSKGLLAIVIDDLGRDLAAARRLAALPAPVTFAVLPNEEHTAEVVALARSRGLSLMLHLPMEPVGFPEVNPGPGALLAAMDSATLLRTLRAGLDQAPGAIGVNNHMGSLFTQLPGPMRLVLGELRSRGLFFLDSLTTGRSQARALCREMGLPYLRRAVFLDNVRERSAIRRQLALAERLAAATGQAVAIGHPYPETIAALEEWAQAGPLAAEAVPVARLSPENGSSHGLSVLKPSTPPE